MGGGLPGSYLTNYLSVDRVSCQICRIVVASLKQNIFLYVKFILRELLQIYSIKFRFFNEYFCFCYLKNSSCTLNRRWWREGGRGENFFLTMACGVKGRGGQMIVKSCVSVKKSFSRLGFFPAWKRKYFCWNNEATVGPQVLRGSQRIAQGRHSLGAFSDVICVLLSGKDIIWERLLSYLISIICEVGIICWRGRCFSR